MMNNKYPLEWLDALVLEHLDPHKTDLSQMTETDLAVVSENVIKETERIRVRIKNEIFALRRKRQIRLLVRKYHSIFIFLLDTMVEHQKKSGFQLSSLSSTAQVVVGCLDGLLSFIESRFSDYLSLDEKIPITYFLVFRKEVLLKLEKLEKTSFGTGQMKEILKIVTGELKDLLSIQDRVRLTFRQLLYERKLLQELEEMDLTSKESVFTTFDHKLVELNFNSPVYIDFLVERILCEAERQEHPAQKLSQMSFYLKEFNQMYSDQRLFFNAGLESVKTTVENWFRHEMIYLEKRLEIMTASTGEIDTATQSENKLECDLSADQIGIILRAADEARVVKSRSMSLVFQRIVPHLSTAFKRDLSYQSVRSKSYNAEENDKNIAILTLEKMIKKIRSY